MRARPTRQGIIVMVVGRRRARRRAPVRPHRAVRDRRRAARRRARGVARRADPPATGRGRAGGSARRSSRPATSAASRSSSSRSAAPARPRSSSSSRSGATRTARMAVTPLGPDADVSAGYRIPTERRGVLADRPARSPYRQDVLGLARSTTMVAGVEEVLVSPRAHLARHAAARPGCARAATCSRSPSASDPATSTACGTTSTATSRAPSTGGRRPARSTLKVRQHSVEGLQRCVVLLDQHVPRGPDGEEAFERAVTAAASVVHSADRAGLTTRFVTSDGADLRGPDVAATTLHLLARIAISDGPTVSVERDPSEGLGLVVSIGVDPWHTSWTHARQGPGADADRRLHDGPRGTARRCWPSTPAARTSFLQGWGVLAGGTRTGGRRDPRQPDPVLAEVRPVTGGRRLHGAARRPARRSEGRREALDLAATVALAAYSFVAALGFARVFADWQFVADVACRGRRRPRRLAAAAPPPRPGPRGGPAHRRRPRRGRSPGCRTPTRSPPSSRPRQTWDIAWADLGLVRDQFQHAVAPGRVRRRLVAAGRHRHRLRRAHRRHVRLPRPRPGRGARARRRAVRVRRRARRRPSPHRSDARPRSPPGASPPPCCGPASPSCRGPRWAGPATRSP